jgi:hypothetical protein
MMKIRSWYIAIMGVLTQLLLSIYLMFNIGDISPWLGLFVTLIAAYMLGYSIISLIPIPLLAFKKTLKLGGVIAILLGALGIISQVGLIAGISLLVAGVLALFKNI